MASQAPALNIPVPISYVFSPRSRGGHPDAASTRPHSHRHGPGRCGVCQRQPGRLDLRAWRPGGVGERRARGDQGPRRGPGGCGPRHHRARVVRSRIHPEPGDGRRARPLRRRAQEHRADPPRRHVSRWRTGRRDRRRDGDRGGRRPSRRPVIPVRRPGPRTGRDGRHDRRRRRCRGGVHGSGRSQRPGPHDRRRGGPERPGTGDL